VSVSGATARRSYELHGVRVEVQAEELAVVEAMDLRLRDFRADHASTADLRFEFVTDGAGAANPPAGTGRPVYDTPHGSLHYFPEDDALCGELGGVLLRCDAGHGTALLRATELAGRQLYFATHPLATISLMELFERRGLFSLHAACLAGPDGRGVLLAGPSGSGKSTLALALARAGMSFLSDDVVFLAADGQSSQPRVRVLGFADTIGVPDHAVRVVVEKRDAWSRFSTIPAPFAEIALGASRIPGFPKRLARIEELFGTPASDKCDPAAIVFPEVVPDQPSELSPLDPGEALLRLAPDVLLTEPAATQAHLQAIGALLDQVDCYTLRSGADLDRAAELVRELVCLPFELTQPPGRQPRD
jgi:hypothetical protein